LPALRFQREGAVGGHALLAVGYDDKSECFIVRNSWGDRWSKKGYSTMLYSYLRTDNLSDDFWTIHLVH
jgi:C1A family cysteine protease